MGGIKALYACIWMATCQGIKSKPQLMLPQGQYSPIYKKGGQVILIFLDFSDSVVSLHAGRIGDFKFLGFFRQFSLFACSRDQSVRKIQENPTHPIPLNGPSHFCVHQMQDYKKIMFSSRKVHEVHSRSKSKVSIKVSNQAKIKKFQCPSEQEQEEH